MCFQDFLLQFSFLNSLICSKKSIIACSTLSSSKYRLYPNFHKPFFNISHWSSLHYHPNTFSQYHKKLLLVWQKRWTANSSPQFYMPPSSHGHNHCIQINYSGYINATRKDGKRAHTSQDPKKKKGTIKLFRRTTQTLNLLRNLGPYQFSPAHMLFRHSISFQVQLKDTQNKS